MITSQHYRAVMESFSIRGRDRKIHPFRFNPAQEIIWKAIAPMIDRHQPVWFIVLKARREGASTLIQALLLAKVLLEDLVNAVVMAHMAPSTQEIWKMAKTMVSNSAWKPTAEVVTKQIVVGQSSLTCMTAGSPDATRAFDISAFHASEVAFWQDSTALLAAMQCLPEGPGTICAIESTANGRTGDGRLFYEEWQRAETGESGVTPIFLPWFVLPEYNLPGRTVEKLDPEETALVKLHNVTPSQLAWRRQAIRTRCQGSVERFHQEYPSTPGEAFTTSGLPMFTRSVLNYYEQFVEPGLPMRVKLDGSLIKADTSPWRIYRPPVPGRAYLVGADSAMGIDDPRHSESTCEVIDMESLEQVAEFHGHVSPHLFAQEMVGIGRAYNEALLVPEIQASGGGGGMEVLAYIQQYGYFNIHRWRKPDRVQKNLPPLYGWETTFRSRPRLIARLEEHLTEKCVVIHSRALLDQLGLFGYSDKDRMEALAGHDDLVMAYAIALVSRSENYYPMPKELDTDEPVDDGFPVTTVAGYTDESPPVRSTWGGPQTKRECPAHLL